jgi:hypothetical protein
MATYYLIVAYLVTSYAMWAALPNGFSAWRQAVLAMLWPITVLVAIFKKLLNA